MSKKLDIFVRILAIVLGALALAAGFMLKGKMDVALTNTAWAVTDPEVKAGKEYDARMTSLAGVKGLLDAKRKEIEEANLAKKDLNATVADKNTKIEGLTAANTTLEGERTELTRKRDELAAQLTDANSKKDGAVAELTTVKEDLVRATEKAAGMFTKEQLAEIEAKATKAEELAAALRGKYTALHAWAARAAENNAPGGFQRDPFGEPAKEGDAPTAVAVSVEAATDSVLTNVLALDAKSGIVAFSVGEANGIKEKAVFDVKVDGKKIGKVQISSVKGSLSYGQLQPDKDLDLGAIAKAASVSLVPSTKLASK
jgi:chromosome segregation ATPase